MWESWLAHVAGRCGAYLILLLSTTLCAALCYTGELPIGDCAPVFLISARFVYSQAPVVKVLPCSRLVFRCTPAFLHSPSSDELWRLPLATFLGGAPDVTLFQRPRCWSVFTVPCQYAYVRGGLPAAVSSWMAGEGLE